MTPPADGRLRHTIAGAVGAIAALSAGELMAVLLGSDVTPVTAVGSEFVDRYAATLKDIAIALFGTNDKVALITGVVIVSIGAGAVLGRVARHSRRVFAAGLGAFGILGAVALATDPQGSFAAAVASSAVAVVAGTAAFVGTTSARRTTDPESATDPTGRRAFVTRSMAVVAVSGVALATRRSIVASRLTEVARRIVALPSPAARVEVPSATLDATGASNYLTPTSEFYRIDTALSVPRVDPESWRLKIDGLVDRPVELTYEDLLGMDSVEVPVTIQCVSNSVGGDLVGTAMWQGVPLADVLALAGVRSGATQVVGRSVDGWTAGFPFADALDGRTAIVAYGMNGQPLPAAHGFPARLIVAGLYGYVSATKWLSELELTTWEAFDGYWVPRGWSKLGPIKLTSRIDVPRASDRPPAGPVTIAGVAWHPSVGVSKVEVQIDGGAWRAAELGPVASTDTWVQWTLAWDATSGDHELRVRATGADGVLQTEADHDPAPDGATGWHRRRIRIT